VKEGTLYLALSFIFMVAVLVFFVVPLLWLALSAFNPHATPALEVPAKPSLQNFAGLFKPVGMVCPYQWIINSIIVSTASATLAVLLSLPSASVFSRFPFRGQGAMLSLFVVLRLVPPIVIALPIMVLYRMWGLINTLQGLILALSAFVLPFTLLLLESSLRTIPTVYEEAAMVDGCTKLGAFMRVTLPLAMPGIATSWLLAFVTVWSEFVITLMVIRSPSLMTASVGLRFFFGEYGRVDYGRLSAFSILYSIPILITFFAIRKYLRRGIAGLASR